MEIKGFPMSGAPKLEKDNIPEIVDVTPEMVAAGIEVVHSFDAFFSLSPTLETLLVEGVVKAALERVARPASVECLERAPS